MSLRFINFNGALLEDNTAVAPVNNPGLKYGFGLFETMLVHNKKVRLIDHHWERLNKSMMWLGFKECDLSHKVRFEELILKTVDANKITAFGKVRLQVFAYNKDGHLSNHFHPAYFIECSKISVNEVVFNQTGLAIGLSPDLKKCSGALSNIKSSNAINYVIAAAQCARNGWDDLLITNEEGLVVESSIANVFVVKARKIYTPPLSSGCIDGVMRRYLLEKIPSITQCSLTEAEILNADEVFLTNAIKGVKWVAKYKEASYGCEYTKAYVLPEISKI